MSAKIQLSEEELNLVQNAQWLLTKNNIIVKVFELFGDIAHDIRDRLAGKPLPVRPAAELLQPAPKISKGENYQGLPYVMLDYPRVFGKEDVFAIRTMFWWGHYFSVTLHLKGRYKDQYKSVLLHNLPLLAQHDFYMCISENEWRHELAGDNYKQLTQMDLPTIEKTWQANEFCKLSAKISLSQWNQSKELLCALYEMIFTSLGH
jgi:hypothetical protein